MSDISTPLAAENYLEADQGCAVGLDVTPERFTNLEILDALDVKSNIPGLFLTGQDVLLCGVTLCQVSSQKKFYIFLDLIGVFCEFSSLASLLLLEWKDFSRVSKFYHRLYVQDLRNENLNYYNHFC